MSTTVETESVFLAGEWQTSESSGTFSAMNPATGETLPEQYPVSSWADCEKALASAAEAAETLRGLGPQKIAAFLERFADLIDENIDELAAIGADRVRTRLAPAPLLWLAAAGTASLSG